MLTALALNNIIKEKIVNNEKYYILLDEIQKVHEFESALNGVLRLANLDIYVSGSNFRSIKI